MCELPSAGFALSVNAANRPTCDRLAPEFGKQRAGAVRDEKTDSLFLKLCLAMSLALCFP
jgi:hypothetical protein